MASDRRSSSSSTSAASSFDEMLERNRRELDGMYGGIAWTGAREAPPPGAASPARAASAERPVVRKLNQRFGDKWRYEITERRRDGDEVIVLCRLTLPERNVTKAQFGLAPYRPCRRRGGCPRQRRGRIVHARRGRIRFTGRRQRGCRV